MLLVFAAVVFATAINRLVGVLQRLHLKRGIAIAVSIILLLMLIIGVSVAVVPPFIDQLQQLIELVPTGLERIRSWSEWLRNFLPDQFLEDIRGLRGLIQQLQSVAPRVFSNIYTLLSNSIGTALKILLVLVLVIMFLSSPDSYRQGFIQLFPSFYRRCVDEILQKSESALGGWVTGILFNMTIIAAMSGIGLWLLKIPLAFTNAILAGLLTFIPNLGPTLSVIPPMALGLPDTPWKAGAVLALYILIQQLESNVLTPLVMQKQVSLLPAVTLISQLIFASFFGFLRLFLALPIVVVAQIWIKEILIIDILNSWQQHG